MLPSTSDFIKKYGLDAKKSLGQNFILDKNFTDKIAKSALEKDKSDFSDEIILEIGPGPASLTRSILDLNPKKLVVVEKDQRCIEILREIQDFYGKDKLEIINEDALKIDESIIFGAKKIKIIANLPYNIGTLLVLRWLKSAVKISSMTLMLQKEVAQRFCAKVNDENYGRLAIIAKNLAESEILFSVNKSNFTPPPKVTSAIIKIMPRQKALFDVEISKLEKITALAFNQRRKMIKSSLKNAEFDLKIEELLKKLAINETLRPENLDLSQFCDLAQHLK